MTTMPVEVAIFEPRRIKRRNGIGDPIYEFTFTPDTQNDGIFCDSPGERPGSIAWGMSLDPVPLNSDIGRNGVMSASALYIESTGPELLHFIECLQSLYDVNYDAEGKLRDE